MKRTGVLLLQLGTPDNPSNSAVRKYLSEFLNDPRVIDIPWISRKLLVNCIIVPFRAPKSAKIYQELWQYGNGTSPLLTHTQILSQQLGEKLAHQNVEVEFAMRYQNPSMDTVLARMKKQNYDQIILLPLFPQYASSSSGSAFEKAFQIIKNWWNVPQVKAIGQFYDNAGYINSIVDNALKYDLKSYDHIVFSYHGLPLRQLNKSHTSGECKGAHCATEINRTNNLCYKATCYATTRILAQKLALNDADYTVSFQSRLNEKWVKPFSDEVVKNLAKNGAKKILLFSPAFVADCLETIIEIGTEYKNDFIQLGGEQLDLVESCNTHPFFVKGILQLIQENL